MSIEVSQISKTFGKFRALDNVNLQVPDGELVALLGPSGSGKTTLLRIIAGLETPDEGPGAVVFDGEDVAFRPVGKRRVGFVFQHYALFRHMTVFENIAFGLKVRPRFIRPSHEEISDKVRTLLKLIQLEGLEHRYPAQLSGGQRQRIALARALAIEPKVLLLDEPFGALDAKVRVGLRRWLRKLHDEIHVTSVFVTHDQDEALEVADRIVVMNHGRIEQVGTPDEVFHHPANEFVIDFLGNVNLFHGRVEEGKAVFGPLAVAHPNGQEGRTARLFVRPFDLEVHSTRDKLQDGVTAMPAKVLRVQSAGSTVKIELQAQDGETFHAEIPHDRFREDPVEANASVFVTPKSARVFEDYSI